MLLSIGAEVDIATSDELRGAHDDLYKRLKGLAVKPIHNTITASITVAAGATVIDLGHPPSGRLWEIRSLTLAGSDDHTAVNGAAALYVGDSNNVSLAQMRVPGLSIPSYTPFPGDGLWAYSSEAVFVNLFAVAVGQGVMATCGILEWRLADATQMSGK